MFDYLESNLT